MMPARLACPPDWQVHLVCGPHRAVIAPTAGGRVLRLSSRIPSGVHDWLAPVEVDAWPADAWPKGGIFPLAPFSNRIRDGVFPWAGRSIELDRYPGQPHALHGFAQEGVWTVVDQAQDRVVMEYTHRAGGRGWPWAWHARQSLRLHEHGFSLTMEVSNLSGESMPLGMGYHPYFTARSVDLDARTLWTHEQELAIAPQANPTRDWGKGRETWTAFLSDWDGRCAIHWENGLRLDMDAHGSMHHVVLHAPMGRYLCVEPVTHVCDAFNLAARGVSGTGVQSLPPGQCARIELDLAWSMPT